MENKLEKSQILASPWGHSKKLLFYFFTRTLLKTKKCYFKAFEMLRGVLQIENVLINVIKTSAKTYVWSMFNLSLATFI